MSFIDVLIPMIAGLLLVASPQIFIKPTGSETKVAEKKDKLRKMGILLIGVAALYFAIKLASPR